MILLARRVQRFVRVAFVGCAGLLAAAASLVLVGWLTLHWGILPQLDLWKPQIEARAGRALGVPVQIGSIQVRSSGWVPSFELRDIVLHDAAGRPALTLPRVLAAVSPRSLLSLDLRFEQLLIDGAQLDVRRDAQGRLIVGGLVLGSGTGDAGAATDWFFRQHEFVIRGGTLRWTDEARGAPPLALTDLQLVVRNGLRRHDVRIDATPPADWGARFTLTGRFTQPLLARAGDWRRWSGDAHADLPRADVRELRRHVDLPFELTEGNGALRVWLKLTEGEASAATADIALRAVRIRLGREIEPLTLREVQGRIEGARTDQGFTLAARQFGFVTDDEARWPATDMNFVWRQRRGQPTSGGEFGVQRLDLAMAARVARRVPLSAPIRQWLDDAQPQGVATGLSVQWQGPIEQPTHYRSRANVDGLSWRAGEPDASGHGARPGVGNVNLAFDATEAGGTATLAVRDGMLEFPGLFEQPQIALAQLDAQLAWRSEPAAEGRGPPKLSLTVKDGRFANADVQGELTAAWNTGEGAARFPGRLDLNGKLGAAAAERVVRYVPLHAGVTTRDYLRHSILRGRMAGATFKVRGNLREFPFAPPPVPVEGASAVVPKRGLTDGKGSGEFRVVTQVENVDFVYIPGPHAAGGPLEAESAWPPFSKLQGELIFDRGAMEIRNARASVDGLDVVDVQGRVPDLADHATLSIGGTVKGAMSDLLHYANTSPVGGWLSHALATTSATGPAELALALVIPFQQAHETTVKGVLALPGNDLRLRPDAPLLVGAKGRIEFTEHGFGMTGASARLLGGEVTFDGGTAPEGGVRFVGGGSISAESLRRSPELRAVARAAESLSGQLNYRASVAARQGRAEFSVQSNLVGLGVALPAPFGKSAEAALPLTAQTTLSSDASTDTLRVELGKLLQMQFVRDLSGDQPSVLRGGIALGDAPLPTPAEGVAANINVDVLNVDAWKSVATAWFPGNEGGDASPGGYLPTRVAFRARDVSNNGRRLSSLVAGASFDDGTWRINLDAEQLDGYVEYRAPQRGSGRVFARLARLSLPKSEAEQVDTLLDPQVTTVPALDIVIEDFELHGNKLGRVEVEAVNRRTGIGEGREWRLSRLSLVTPEARLTGTGQWARRRATMEFQLDMSDSGALLDRLAVGRTIRRGKGMLSGQVSWLGSPLSLDYPTLSGQVQLALESGQFLKGEPGAARLLSVLSLQSLPRRFLLDFRDLFQEGFAFDSITGEVTITNGSAYTNNLRMRGVQATVLMEGRADLARETQALRVVIVPEIDAGTASLAYAVINPAIGLGTYLAQLFLRRPLIRAGTREFNVTGSWAEPKIERVQRASDAPIPDVNEPLPSQAGASAPALEVIVPERK